MNRQPSCQGFVKCDHLGRGGAIDALAVQLPEVLARMHPAGILHRDLKPQEVLVDREDRVHWRRWG